MLPEAGGIISVPFTELASLVPRFATSILMEPVDVSTLMTDRITFPLTSTPIVFETEYVVPPILYVRVSGIV